MEPNSNPRRFNSWDHAVDMYFTPGDRNMSEMSQEMYLQARHEYPVESIHGTVQAAQKHFVIDKLKVLHEILAQPWEKVRIDLLISKERNCMLTLDY